MLFEARQIVELQVARARRRLFLQTLLHTCAAVWAIALVLSVGWLLAEPYLVTAPAEWLRWVVAGGLMLVATIAGIWLTVRRRPSQMAAALSIDQLFGLRERVVTSFALSPEEANTP